MATCITQSCEPDHIRQSAVVLTFPRAQSAELAVRQAVRGRQGRELAMAETAAPADHEEIAPNIASDLAPKIGPPVALWQIAHTFFLIGLASFSLAALDEARRWVTEKRKW